MSLKEIKNTLTVLNSNILDMSNPAEATLNRYNALNDELKELKQQAQDPNADKMAISTRVMEIVEERELVVNQLEDLLGRNWEDNSLKGIRNSLKKLINSEKNLSPNDIFDYINELHQKGWEETDYQDEEWVGEHDNFVLKFIPFSDSSVNWIFSAYPLYKDRKTEYPPIVISADGHIMDGSHRIASAKARGDEGIWAYRGVGSMSSQSLRAIRNSLIKLSGYDPEAL